MTIKTIPPIAIVFSTPHWYKVNKCNKLLFLLEISMSNWKNIYIGDNSDKQIYL